MTSVFLLFLQYLALAFVLNGPIVGCFSFKYHEGLCRTLTPENQDVCCTEGPRHPESDQFQGKLLVAVGPRKTGTTLLYSILKQSPDLLFPEADVKETHFFSTGVPINAGKDLVQRNGTLKEYEDFWGSVDSAEKRTYVDMTSDYFRDPGTPCRIKRMAPNAKILITLRDPAWRALSLTSMTRTQCYRDHFTGVNKLNEKYPWICCAVTRSLEHLFTLAQHDMMSRPGCDFHGERSEKTWMECGSKEYDHNPIQVGMYAAIIAWWFEFFPPEDVLVLESKNIEEDLAREVNRILAFVGASAMNPKIESANPFSGAYKWKEPNLPDTIRQLHAFFERPERELAAFLSLNNKSIGLLKEWDLKTIYKSEKGQNSLQDSCVTCTELEDDCGGRLNHFYSKKSIKKRIVAPKKLGVFEEVCLAGFFFLTLLVCYKKWPWFLSFKRSSRGKRQRE